MAALGLPLLVPASLPLYAVEGLAEDLTVFSLLLLGGMGVLRRCAWCGTAAFLLTMEELNWFQPWLGFPTPPWLQALSPKSGQANLHNIPGLDLLWRWLPVSVICALAWRPRWPALDAWAARLRLPLVHPGAGGVLVLLVVLSPPLILLRGQRVWDEALELALVLWAASFLRAAGPVRTAP